MPPTGAGVVPVSWHTKRQAFPKHPKGDAVVVVVVLVVLVLVVVVLVVVVVVVFAQPPVGPVHSKLLFAVKIQSPVHGPRVVVVGAGVVGESEPEGSSSGLSLHQVPFRC